MTPERHTALAASLLALIVAPSCATSNQAATSNPPAADAAAPADAGTARRPDGPIDCGDTQSSPGNCGACDHDCLGGTCKAGKCQPVAISGSSSTSGIAVGTDYLYFGDRSAHVVARVDKRVAKQARYEILAKDQQYPYGMTIDGADLFWTDLGQFVAQSQGILDITPNTGAVATLDSNGAVSFLAKPVDQPTELRIVGNEVYWSTITGVYAAPRAGGPARRLTVERADNLAVDDSTVYFVDNAAGELRQIARTATNASSTLLATIDLADCVEQDADAIYVCANDLQYKKRGGIARVTRDGDKKYLVTGADGVMALKLSGDDIFYSDYGNGISRVPRDGSAPAEPLYQGRAGPMAMDESAIYFYDRQAQGVFRLAR